jgi:uncharacterized protein
MKIILDTNVYFSAFGFKGKLFELLRYCLESESIDIFFSKETFYELEQKLLGKKFAKTTQNRFSDEDILGFIQKVKESSIFATPNSHFSLSRDLKDNMILDLAFEVKADFVITGDVDLLILKELEGTKIVKPSQFLTQLAQNQNL